MKKIHIATALLMLLLCPFDGVAEQNKLTVIVYDVHSHKFVPGIKVEVFPLSAHNTQLGYMLSEYMLSDPNSYLVIPAMTSTTDIEGRATFDTNELLQVVDRVNKELAESPRKLITPHYEVGIYTLARGYQCTDSDESLHQILSNGVVGEIGKPCKSDGKIFHAAPGEIIMFVTHGI